MWETWIKIGPKKGLTSKNIQDAIRYGVGSIFPRLLEEGKIIWYHFLMHPFRKDPSNVYFHIRYSPTEIFADDDLPDYCVLTRKISPRRRIQCIDKSLLKNEEIEEAWRIIGQQSEWIINLIKIHKEENEVIPIEQIIQFMHYYFNMLGLGHIGKITIGDIVLSF